jgi:hypothetical protein
MHCHPLLRRKGTRPIADLGGSSTFKNMPNGGHEATNRGSRHARSLDQNQDASSTITANHTIERRKDYLALAASADL